MGARHIDTSPEAAVRDGGREYYEQVWLSLPRCVHCSRPIRPFRAQLRDWPATASRATVDVCSTCYNKGLRSEGSTRYQTSSLGKHQKPPVPVLGTRAQVAAQWTAEERSAALQLCSLASNADEARDALDHAGLFMPKTGAHETAIKGGVEIHHGR